LYNDIYTNEQTTVVTKEEKVTAVSSRRIKIPNVCKKMEVYNLPVSVYINNYRLVVQKCRKINIFRKLINIKL